MSVKTGGPAFPRTGRLDVAKPYKVQDQAGMTLRDWFAGQALTGVLAESWHPDMGHAPPSSIPAARMAVYAYTLADAMIAAREVEK